MHNEVWGCVGILPFFFLKYYPVAVVLSGKKICTGEEGKMKGGAKKG